jgi:hypothetical protein
LSNVWKRIFRTVKATVKAKVKKLKKKHGFRRVIQGHHITYDPEWIVQVYQGEHWICTMLQRRTHVSKGFVSALKYWLDQHEKRAVDLGGEVK